MPIGSITRGTTGTNRLRRVDRWIAAHPAFLRADDPLVVDLGYGASATTPLELHQRLLRVRGDVEVVGVEIDPERVRRASLSARPGVSFRRGGFEVPLDAGRRPAVIRAFNVLRQYDESAVAEAWGLMTARLQPGGHEAPEGPHAFTISLRLADLDVPSIVAERLPKALIHRNVAGERVHDLLVDLDRQWAVAAPLSVYGPVQRWLATVQGLRDAGWPVRHGRSRWRLGELSLPWASVAPRT
jgi:hypothetical protein